MQQIPFQITRNTSGDNIRFIADGDPTDEAQLDLFREFEDHLERIGLDYDNEEYGHIETANAKPWQQTDIRTRFHNYLLY